MITADDAATQTDAFGQSAQNYGQASNAYSNMLTGSGTLSNINEYINPYYDQVLNRVLGRMDTDFNKQLGQIGDSAQASGAFGGGRHGIVEGEAYGQHNLNVGDVSANIQQQAYADAAERAYRDQVTGAQGLTGLGSDYFNIGNTIQQNQLLQGSMEQQMLQSILDQSASMYDNYMNDPYQMIDMLSALLGGDIRSGSGSTEQSATSTPGIFDYLSLAAQAV